MHIEFNNGNHYTLTNTKLVSESDSFSVSFARLKEAIRNFSPIRANYIHVTGLGKSSFWMGKNVYKEEVIGIGCRSFKGIDRLAILGAMSLAATAAKARGKKAKTKAKTKKYRATKGRRG